MLLVKLWLLMKMTWCLSHQRAVGVASQGHASTTGGDSGEEYEQEEEEAEEDMVEISHLQQRRKEGMRDTPTARI